MQASEEKQPTFGQAHQVLIDTQKNDACHISEQENLKRMLNSYETEQKSYAADDHKSNAKPHTSNLNPSQTVCFEHCSLDPHQKQIPGTFETF